MNINLTMSGVGSTARERGLALVRLAVARRETALAAPRANISSSNQQSPKGGK
jgi:hypothetical protein